MDQNLIPSLKVNNIRYFCVTLLYTDLLHYDYASSVEYQNNYVSVKVVAQTTSISCIFPGMVTRAVDNSCNATIIYGPNCQNRENLVGVIVNSSLISIELRGFLTQTRASRYCGFLATVSTGEKTLTVEGNLGESSTLNVA